MLSYYARAAARSLWGEAWTQPLQQHTVIHYSKQVGLIRLHRIPASHIRQFSTVGVENAASAPDPTATLTSAGVHTELLHSFPSKSISPILLRENYSRIVFAGNPWSDRGHSIKVARFGAIICTDGQLRICMHIETDLYDAEDPVTEEDLEDAESGNETCGEWESKVVWDAYHNCIFSTQYGILMSPGFDLRELLSRPLGSGYRMYNINPLGTDLQIPPKASESDDRAFHVYLLGHDGSADHDIIFTPSQQQPSIDTVVAPRSRYFDLWWRGALTLEYVGEKKFKHRFEALIRSVPWSGISQIVLHS